MGCNNPTFGEATEKSEEGFSESATTFKVVVKKLTGNDTATFNATINALRAGSFINFVAHYEQELDNFFKGVIYEDLANKKKFDLSIGYGKLPIQTIAKCFEDVLKQREVELKPLFSNQTVEFAELDNSEKIRYILLYQYGDKIGGYPALAGMSMEEALKLHHYFNVLATEKDNALKQAMEKNNE